MNGVSSLTEEQWERLIKSYRDRGMWQVVQGLRAAKEFHESIEKIQNMAGHSQEQLSEVSQAILSMTQEGGQPQP